MTTVHEIVFLFSIIYYIYYNLSIVLKQYSTLILCNIHVTGLSMLCSNKFRLKSGFGGHGVYISTS